MKHTTIYNAKSEPGDIFRPWFLWGDGPDIWAAVQADNGENAIVCARCLHDELLGASASEPFELRREAETRPVLVWAGSEPRAALLDVDVQPAMCGPWPVASGLTTSGRPGWKGPSKGVGGDVALDFTRALNGMAKGAARRGIPGGSVPGYDVAAVWAIRWRFPGADLRPACTEVYGVQYGPGLAVFAGDKQNAPMVGFLAAPSDDGPRPWQRYGRAEP